MSGTRRVDTDALDTWAHGRRELHFGDSSHACRASKAPPANASFLICTLPSVVWHVAGRLKRGGRATAASPGAAGAISAAQGDVRGGTAWRGRC